MAIGAWIQLISKHIHIVLPRRLNRRSKLRQQDIRLWGVFGAQSAFQALRFSAASMADPRSKKAERRVWWGGSGGCGVVVEVIETQQEKT